MWETVAHALRNPYTRNVVDDWQPLWWAMLAQWHPAPSGVVLYLAVIAMVAALAVALAAAPRADDLPLVAVAAMMALAAFLSVRNMALAAMAMSGPLARHLAVLRARSAGAGRPVAPWPPASHFAILALACVMALSGGLFSRRLAQDRAYPSAALAFMNAHGLHGNVLGEFGWGEYLIWHAAPEDKVFIDGRYDTVYPFKVIRDYLDFYFDQPGAGAVLDSYPHDFVLIGPRRARAPPDGAAARLEAALSRRRCASLRTRERARGTPARLTCNRNRACRADFHDALAAPRSRFRCCVTRRHSSPSSSWSPTPVAGPTPTSGATWFSAASS